MSATLASPTINVVSSSIVRTARRTGAVFVAPPDSGKLFENVGLPTIFASRSFKGVPILGSVHTKETISSFKILMNAGGKVLIPWRSPKLYNANQELIQAMNRLATMPPLVPSLDLLACLTYYSLQEVPIAT